MILYMKDGVHPSRVFRVVHQIIIEKVNTIDGTFNKLAIWYENKELPKIECTVVSTYDLHQINISDLPPIICNQNIVINTYWENNYSTVKIKYNGVEIKKTFPFGIIPTINIYYTME